MSAAQENILYRLYNGLFDKRYDYSHTIKMAQSTFTSCMREVATNIPENAEDITFIGEPVWLNNGAVTILVYNNKTKALNATCFFLRNETQNKPKPDIHTLLEIASSFSTESYLHRPLNELSSDNLPIAGVVGITAYSSNDAVAVETYVGGPTSMFPKQSIVEPRFDRCIFPNVTITAPMKSSFILPTTVNHSVSKWEYLYAGESVMRVNNALRLLSHIAQNHLHPK